MTQIQQTVHKLEIYILPNSILETVREGDEGLEPVAMQLLLLLLLL